MAFRAVHAQWGAIFAHLPDLGSGQSGKPCGRPGRPRRYVSDECRHPMHARTSRTGLRFFTHAPGAPACALGLESAAHHLLKLELTAAAPDAGAHAELEVPGPGSAWRAEALATDPTWAWKTAPGAQLASPITNTDITARTEKTRTDSPARPGSAPSPPHGSPPRSGVGRRVRHVLGLALVLHPAGPVQRAPPHHRPRPMVTRWTGPCRTPGHRGPGRSPHGPEQPSTVSAAPLSSRSASAPLAPLAPGSQTVVFRDGLHTRGRRHGGRHVHHPARRNPGRCPGMT